MVNHTRLLCILIILDDRLESLPHGMCREVLEEDHAVCYSQAPRLTIKT